jgi:hypothetical protein
MYQYLYDQLTSLQQLQQRQQQPSETCSCQGSAGGSLSLGMWYWIRPEDSGGRRHRNLQCFCLGLNLLNPTELCEHITDWRCCFPATPALQGSPGQPTGCLHLAGHPQALHLNDHCKSSEPPVRLHLLTLLPPACLCLLTNTRVLSLLES